MNESHAEIIQTQMHNTEEKSMANTVKVHKKIFLGILFVGALVLYLMYTSVPDSFTQNRLRIHYTWKTHDFVPVPQQILDKAEAIPKPQGTQVVFPLNKEKIKVFQREIMPKNYQRDKYTVLLLHGAAFTSKTWVEIKTMRLIAAMGYRVVALDLPGYGASKSTVVKDKAAFLKEFIHQKGLGAPIIITPSMSGQFALPYMMIPPSTCAERVSALIAIAPVMTEKFAASKYHRCEIPAMVVYGGKDKDLGLRSVGNLRNLANSEVFEMEGAGHAAYIDSQEEWSKLVYNFLLGVERDKH